MNKTLNRKVVRVTSMAATALVVLLGANLAKPTGAQAKDPTTTSVSSPIQGWVDVLNKNRTQVIDSVFLSGNVHFVVQVWQSSPTEIKRLTVHANFDDVSGTSPTTGQRYRGVSGSSVDLLNPSTTALSYAWLALPDQTFTFGLLRVDPEPASLNGSQQDSNWVTPVYMSTSSEPKRCQAVYDKNGNLTRYMKCPRCPGDPASGIYPDPDCGDIFVVACSCATPVYDETGKVAEWICDGNGCAAAPSSPLIPFIGVSRFLRFRPCPFDTCP